MNVGELEEVTGIGRDAIRFYERKGLLGRVPRRANNYRSYPPSVVKEIKLLRGMQALGFSLAEIKQVLQGLRSRGVDCWEGARLLADRRLRVEAQIRDLRKVSRVLAKEQRRLEESGRKAGPRRSPRASRTRPPSASPRTSRKRWRSSTPSSTICPSPSSPPS